jgi:hypothetical protein
MTRRIAIGVLSLACLGTLVSTSHGQTPRPVLNTLKEVGDALAACWRPPPAEEAAPGMEITVLLSFNRAGEILGEPRFTFLTRGASTAVRAAYQRAVAATLKRCTPMKFTPALAAALAGRPFSMRFIDKRRPAERRA